MEDPNITFALNPDYSVTTTRKTMTTGVTIASVFGIIFILVVLAIIIFCFFYWPTNSVTNPTISVNTPYEPLCQGQWNSQFNSCTCDSIRFGSNCQFQRQLNPYLYTSPATVNYPGTEVLTTPYLSIGTTSQPSCQTTCDGDIDCVGFQWQGNSCTLLSSVTGRSSDYLYSIATQKGIYLKDWDGFRLTDRAFLARNRNSIPNQFTQVYQATGYRQLIIDVVTTINFRPTLVSMPANVIGIYSRFPFTINDIPAASDDVLYFSSGIDLPSSWSGNITVLFTRQQPVVPPLF